MQITESHLKMARLPEGCSEVLPYALPDGTASPFPLLKVRNVYVLPGVPKLVEAKWEPLRRELERHTWPGTAQYRNRHAPPPDAARCALPSLLRDTPLSVRYFVSCRASSELAKHRATALTRLDAAEVPALSRAVLRRAYKLLEYLYTSIQDLGLKNKLFVLSVWAGSPSTATECLEGGVAQPL